jgi:hypothetical protein
MFKCKCGCNEFYAHQIARVDIIVDGDNQFIQNTCEPEGALSVFDSETPYGPYACKACGEEYDEIV